MVTRCPLTWGLFLGSTALMISHHRSKKKTNQKQESGEEEGTASTLPASEVVFVLGAPGTGKGTQCSSLVTNLSDEKWTHLSAGDLLREARDTGTGELADLIRSRMQAGAIVPSEVTVRLLTSAMSKSHDATGSRRFLIDGFPRSRENLEAWTTACGTVHTVKFVLNFECPEEVLVGRLLERGKDSGRSDDTIEVIRRRFKTHVESCVPILESMRESGTVVRTIDSARSVEKVYENVVAYF